MSVRLSVCLSDVFNLHNVDFKKCDFRILVYIFQVQNSRNVLEFSVKLKLHNVAFLKMNFRNIGFDSFFDHFWTCSESVFRVYEAQRPVQLKN